MTVQNESETTELDVDVRTAVTFNDGQKWGGICVDCNEAILTRRPKRSPGMPVAVNRFLIQHREHNTERGTVQTSNRVQELYSEHED